jgi:hypothetical protein
MAICLYALKEEILVPYVVLPTPHTYTMYSQTAKVLTPPIDILPAV